jgi:superfamily II DNA helicase RecQ
VWELHRTARRECSARPLRRRKCDIAADLIAGQARHARFYRALKMQNNDVNEEEAVETGLKITTENAGRFLEYHEAYGVLICVKHGYAVRNLADHLSRNHTGSKRERGEVIKRYRSLVLCNAKDVFLPPPLERPIPALGKPQRAFVCREPECQYISAHPNGIRIHCNKRHNWKASIGEQTYWHPVWVQTFFKSAGLQKYFTVLCDEQEDADRQANETEVALLVRSAEEIFATNTTDNTDVLAITEDWKKQDEKLNEELEVADAETAKTDHTLWFKKTGWAEHIAGCTLKHLSQASRLPDRDEQTLLAAVKLNGTLIERCVGGLSSLDNETRRWLRSAKHSEIDQRPLARLQNVESQRTYAVYMARLLCYSLRVLRSCEDSERLRGTADGQETESRGRESEAGDNSDYAEDNEGESEREGEGEREIEDDSDFGSQPVVDVFKDARRLYPWQGRQRDLLKRVRESIENGWDEKSQLDALLEFYESLIFQHVRGDTFKSAILHFLAVLGIDEETRRLRQANDFSYMLAGIVYCIRVIAVEIILPSEEREDQDDEDDERFKQTRDRFLADGTYSVMSKALSILAYGKSIAMNHSNAGSISWSDDRTEMSYKGTPIDVARFGSMIRGVIEEAEDKLWKDLIWATQEQRFEVPLDKLQDDVTWTKRGVSFVDNANNGLQDKREWMTRRALADARGKKMWKQKEWSRLEVRNYLRKVDRFRELLLFCIHVTGGQPARGTEITSIRFRNGFQQDRNVFAIQGHMVIVTRYHKSQSQFDKPKVIPRFLPWRVGQLLAIYLAYVQPFQQYLTVKVKGLGQSDHVWANEYGPWGTDRLTKIIKRESSKLLGTRLTTLDYRHVAVSLGREKVGEQFSRGYVEETAEVEEPEVDEDDPLEVSAGRGGEVGANRYGVSLDVIKHLSSRSIDTFRPLCQRWHEFLGLASYGGKGQKRRAQSSSGSSSIYTQLQHSDGRLATTMVNNNVRGWGPAMEELRARGQAHSSEEGASNSSWYFGGEESNGNESEQSGNTWDTRQRAATTPSQRQPPLSRPQSTLQFTPQFMPQLVQQTTPQLGQQFTPVQQWMDQHAGQQQMPQVIAGLGVTTPGTTAYLQESPLFNRSTALSAISYIGGGRTIGEEDLKNAMRKALRCSEVSFRSDEQKEALQMIVSGEQTTPLVVVLPTGGGKSLLFTAPACLDDPGVTIVVVPYRALLDNLLATAKKAKIDCMEYRPGEQNPAALVFVSADFVAGSQFLSYAQLLSAKGILRRVFVDECHLTFTASDWRPKLAEVRAVRGLRVPTIMLTATLPVLLEFELEESMAAQMARYIRAVTTRTKTRYIVDVCKPGKLEEEVLELCKRMKKHLGLRKGVVYSRSRDQCERLARELRCAHYHAGAADNEERLKAWLERGGLIVATSALGTGVDFPGVVFTLHIDIPYGMIDFSQESGRAGRAGEDVDSVIVVEEGKAERQPAGGKGRGVDESIIRDFITTRSCRRRVMGLYLDNKEIECGNDASLARCDRCGEGVTALERDYARAARERQIVEETLDEVTDSCVFCFVESTDDAGASWTHNPEECERAEWRRWRDLDERFRRLIKFEESSHSCFKCGFSQRLCNTGVGEDRACQWPNVAAAILRGIPSTKQGVAVIKNAGFEGETADAEEYAKWLGSRHRQRVWGELMSNASALVIEFIVERAKRQAGTDATDEDDSANDVIASESNDARDTSNKAQLEQTIDQEVTVGAERRSVGSSDGRREREAQTYREKRRRVGKRVVESTVVESSVSGEESRQGQQGRKRSTAQTADAAVSEVIRLWERGCVVCRAQGRRSRLEHAWETCRLDVDVTEAVKKGVGLLDGVRAPFRRQGFRCWARGGDCRCSTEGKQGGCSGGETVRLAVAALLFGGKVEIREWVEEQEAFARSIEEGKDGRVALEELLSKKGTYDGEQQIGLDSFLISWAR